MIDSWGGKEMLSLKQLLQNKYDWGSKTAFDLGCGIGIDTLHLLKEGWQVIAVDKSPVALSAVLLPACDKATMALTFKNIPFSELQLSPCNLVNAKFSLPFCGTNKEFTCLWDGIKHNLKKDGFFIGQLFGPEDEWNGKQPLIFHSLTEVQQLVHGYTVIQFLEIKKKAATASLRLKYWHIFHLVLKK